MAGNLDAALRYAKRGLHVFPCHFVRDGRCSCGKADCSSPGKHPIPKDGCLSATTNAKQIETWWRANPQANLGIATGPVSGAFVVDCDGQQGVDDFDQLGEEQGEFPPGLSAETGGGGRHIWFRYPEGATISNGTRLHNTGVDIRGAGGYVLAPPSNHASGNPYRWQCDFDSAEIPEAPQHLLDWIASAKPNGNGKLMMTGDLDNAPGVSEGKRHDTLVEYVGRHLAYGEAGTVVLQKAVAWGRKCSPALDDQEVIKVVTDIEQRHRAETKEQPAAAAEEKKDKPRKSQAQALVELTAGTELFHDTEGIGYASFERDGHVETWPIRSKAFRQWLARRYWQDCRGAPSSQALADATNVLDGCALFDGTEQTVSMRIATGDAGNASDDELRTQSVVIDLGTADWQVVIVTADDWRIVDRSPVKFRRTKGMRPLPIPERGGSVDLLRALLNVRSDDWPLIAAWLLAAYRPQGPYPVLSLFGEAGSSKSTTSRVLRSLIDPNEAPLRRQPRNEHDLVIAAHNSWIVTLDNLSSIPTWLSDGLCRLATGGGFSTRTLYENTEEQLFNASRPVILNGIEELATRGDLVDRTLMVTLERLEDGDRMPESEYWQQVDRHAPQIFGAFLDAVSDALRLLPGTSVENLPRMADFALWSVAGEQAIGLQPGQFLDAYSKSQASANDSVIEACVVGEGIVTVTQNHRLWAGTATELLREVEKVIAEDRRKRKDWPKDGRGMSNRIRRIAPNLRAMGIEVDFSRRNRTRVITLRLEQGGNSPSPSSPMSVTPGGAGSSTSGDGDANCDATDSASVTEADSVSAGELAGCGCGDAGDASDDESRTQSAGRIVMEF